MTIPCPAPRPERSGHRHVPARSRPARNRVRTDEIDETGCVTLRLAGRLHHTGISRAHDGTHVMLVQNLHVRVINAAAGELLGELAIDPIRDYQPTGTPPVPIPRMTDARTHDPWVRASGMS